MLVGFIMLAAKGTFRLTLAEVVLVIAFASMIEALKAGIAFRHPKTSDYFADMAGFFSSLLCSRILEICKTGLWRIIRMPFLFSQLRP